MNADERQEVRAEARSAVAAELERLGVRPSSRRLWPVQRSNTRLVERFRKQLDDPDAEGVLA
jgi:hypothetical protein